MRSMRRAEAGCERAELVEDIILSVSRAGAAVRVAASFGKRDSATVRQCDGAGVEKRVCRRTKAPRQVVNKRLYRPCVSLRLP